MAWRNEVWSGIQANVRANELPLYMMQAKWCLTFAGK